MSAELPVGPNATNATEQLYDLVGDDQLFDQLAELAEQDPDADARPLVLARLEEMGIDLDRVDTAVTPNDPAAAIPPQEEPVKSENLDTDGVMMTRPSNMSSESIDPLIRLRRLL